MKECRCGGLREKGSGKISSIRDGVDVRTEVSQVINET